MKKFYKINDNHYMAVSDNIGISVMELKGTLFIETSNDTKTVTALAIEIEDPMPFYALFNKIQLTISVNLSNITK